MATGIGGIYFLEGFKVRPDNCADTRDEPMDDPDCGKGACLGGAPGVRHVSAQNLELRRRQREQNTSDSRHIF